MIDIHRDNLANLIDEICYYHEEHDNLDTYKKVINLMKNVFILLEPFNVDEIDALIKWKVAWEHDDAEEIKSIRKELGRKRSELYNSYKLKYSDCKWRIGRIDALRDLFYTYDEGESERSNSIDYFVIHMKEAGMSRDAIYVKLKDEWERFKTIHNIN
ncbi:TPA: hypothetical protein JGU28_004554 [Salmonella enterica]|nr:hypothetical protein [Salmonella enterica]